MIDALAAQVKQSVGDKDRAASMLSDARKRYPHSRSLLYTHVRVLHENGRNDDALAALSEPMRLYPKDAGLHQLQARCYAALGKRLLQHPAQAEVYLLQGSLPAAIEQLQLARSAGDGDFYQLSVVDARLKELRAQHASEMRDAKR